MHMKEFILILISIKLMKKLTLSLTPEDPIKIPKIALSKSKWQQDKEQTYLNETSNKRVGRGIYPQRQNTQEMFKAEHTRIDNQSNKGPQDGFYAMALQTNGQNSKTVAKLKVPEALCKILTDLVKGMNQDQHAYIAAIAQWNKLLWKWVEQIQLTDYWESVFEVKFTYQ